MSLYTTKKYVVCCLYNYYWLSCKAVVLQKLPEIDKQLCQMVHNNVCAAYELEAEKICLQIRRCVLRDDHPVLA
jgi:hypothetical protein